MIQRLVCECVLRRESALGRGHGGEFVGDEHGLHTSQRQSGARVEAAHAAVRHRAQQQLAEQHAVGAEVFGVLGPARHLRELSYMIL